MEPEEAARHACEDLSSPPPFCEAAGTEEPGKAADSADLTSVGPQDPEPFPKDKSKIFVHGPGNPNASDSTVAKRRRRNRRRQKNKASAARSHSQYSQGKGVSAKGVMSLDVGKRKRPDPDQSQEDEPAAEETQEQGPEEESPEGQEREDKERVASEGENAHQPPEEEEAQDASRSEDVRGGAGYPRDINNNYVGEWLEAVATSDPAEIVGHEGKEGAESDSASPVPVPTEDLLAPDSLEDWETQRPDLVQEARSIVDEVIAVATAKVKGLAAEDEAAPVPGENEDEAPETELLREEAVEAAINVDTESSGTQSETPGSRPATPPSDAGIQSQASHSGLSQDLDSVDVEPKESQASDIWAAEALQEIPLLYAQYQGGSVQEEAPAPCEEAICCSSQAGEPDSEGERSSCDIPDDNKHALNEEDDSKELRDGLDSLDKKLRNEFHLHDAGAQKQESHAVGLDEAETDEGIPYHADSPDKPPKDEQLVEVRVVGLFANQQFGATTSMASTRNQMHDLKGGSPKGCFGRLCPKNMRRSRASSRATDSRNGLRK